MDGFVAAALATLAQEVTERSGLAVADQSISLALSHLRTEPGDKVVAFLTGSQLRLNPRLNLRQNPFATDQDFGLLANLRQILYCILGIGFDLWKIFQPERIGQFTIRAAYDLSEVVRCDYISNACPNSCIAPLLLL